MWFGDLTFPGSANLALRPYILGLLPAWGAGERLRMQEFCLCIGCICDVIAPGHSLANSLSSLPLLHPSFIHSMSGRHTSSESATPPPRNASRRRSGGAADGDVSDESDDYKPPTNSENTGRGDGFDPQSARERFETEFNDKPVPRRKGSVDEHRYRSNGHHSPRADDKDQIPGLDFSKLVDSSGQPQLRPARAPLSIRRWRVCVEVLQARNLPETGSYEPCAMCCMSLIHLESTTIDSAHYDVDHAYGVGGGSRLRRLSAHYDVDHAYGVGKYTHWHSGHLSIHPQQCTKTAVASTSPAWKQTLTFDDAFPPLQALAAASQSKVQMSAEVRTPLDGQDVVLIVTVHDALGGGRSEFLGKASLPVKVGPPSDNWVVLRARDGGQWMGKDGKSPALLLRIGYGITNGEDIPS
jgi:hypothetical protein